MNTRILTSVLTIVAVVGIASAVTFAYFSDAGTSSGNVFTTGTLDMSLANDNSTLADNATATFGISNGKPGDTFSGDLYIKNIGSVDANNIDLQFDNSVTEASSPPGNVSSVPMDWTIEITGLAFDPDGDGIADNSILGLVTDLNHNGIVDLDDLENTNVDSNVDIDGRPFGGTQSNGHLLHIEGRYSPTLMTSEHIGDSVNTTLTVTMNQDSSQ